MLQILAPAVSLRVYSAEEPSPPLQLQGLTTVSAYFESLYSSVEVSHFELASAEAPEAKAGFSLFWDKVSRTGWQQRNEAEGEPSCVPDTLSRKLSARRAA